jgi:hypothetical protein
VERLGRTAVILCLFGSGKCCSTVRKVSADTAVILCLFSAVGNGARFFVKLPTYPSSVPEVEVPPPQPQKEAKNNKQQRMHRQNNSIGKGNEVFVCGGSCGCSSWPR